MEPVSTSIAVLVWEYALKPIADSIKKEYGDETKKLLKSLVRSTLSREKVDDKALKVIEAEIVEADSGVLSDKEKFLAFMQSNERVKTVESHFIGAINIQDVVNPTIIINAPSAKALQGESVEEDNRLIQTLFGNLTKANAVPQMVITSASTNRLWYTNEIKLKAKKYYSNIYHIALPIYDMSKADYFREMADVFRIEESDPARIQKRLVRLIKESDDKVFVLITDFENDKYLNDFAKLMRSVLDRMGNKLRMITIGGEKLADLKTNMGIHSYFNYFEKHSA